MEGMARLPEAVGEQFSPTDYLYVKSGLISWNSCGAVPGACDPLAIAVIAPGEAVAKAEMAEAR